MSFTNVSKVESRRYQCKSKLNMAMLEAHGYQPRLKTVADVTMVFHIFSLLLYVISITLSELCNRVIVKIPKIV